MRFDGGFKTTIHAKNHSAKNPSCHHLIFERTITIMGRPCSICAHPSHEPINIEIASGTSIKSLSCKYGVSRQALGRHRANCARRLAAAAEAARQLHKAEPAPQIPFNELSRERQLQLLKGKALQLLQIADRSSDIRAALAAIQQLTRLIADEDKPTQRDAARNGAGDHRYVVILPSNGRDNIVVGEPEQQPLTEDDDDTDETSDC
jgi:hypothetical protein